MSLNFIDSRSRATYALPPDYVLYGSINEYCAIPAEVATIGKERDE
jgi:hypothetical protein